MTDRDEAREALLARYRECRRVIQLHLNAALKFVSGATLKEAIRRIGLHSGNVMIGNEFSEMTLAFDLAVFGRKPGRSRAIDRYAQAASFPDGSIEATTLAALRRDSFHVFRVTGKHQTAGLIVDDIAHRQEIWLLDEGLEGSLEVGHALAARLIRPEAFHTTVGAMVPLDHDLLQDALYSLATRRGRLDLDNFDDARLPETIYAAAVGNGTMGSLRFAEDGPAPLE